MPRRSLLLGIVLLTAVGIWSWRAASSRTAPVAGGGAPVPSPQPAESAPAPAKAPEKLSAPAEATPLPQARTAAAPATSTPQPDVPAEPEPPRPRPGTDVDAIFGGAEVIASFYKEIGKEGRNSRVQQLEEVLNQYEGDPKDPQEFAKYEAFKEELEWLRANPGD